jgi:archaeal chaperonin
LKSQKPKTTWSATEPTTRRLASELFKKAEELLEQNIHPTILVSGYRKAAQKAIES